MKNILRLLFVLNIVLFGCIAESGTSNDSDFNHPNAKKVQFYTVLDDILFDNYTINNMIISSIDCDPLESGNICKELNEIISQEGLFFKVEGGDQLIKDSELILTQEGELSLKGGVSFGASGNVMPAECIYSINQPSQNVMGSLIFNFNHIQVLISFKGSI